MNTIDTVNFNDKKVLIRVDFNVPLDNNSRVTDNSRIKSSIPTIKKVLSDNGSVIIMSHLGRPKGVEDKLSLHHILPCLEQELGMKVLFSNNCIGCEAKEKSSLLKGGQVLLLENLRFHKGEEAGDLSFAKELADLADVYINDAFGAIHRAHASVTTIVQFFDANKYFGYLVEREIHSLEKVLKTGEKPITAIIGGAKISTKMPIINKMLDTVDNLIIGGGMTYTFWKAQGGQIGESIYEQENLSIALDVIEAAKEKNVKLYLPVDSVIADSFSNQANTKIANTGEIEDTWQGLDIGPKSIELFKEVIINSKTILWNGPVGVFEFEKFSVGTDTLSEIIVNATKNGAFSLIGGGDSIASVKKNGHENNMSYISTGGGAMLEFLEGKKLPGIKAMLDGV
ncbi:phosphoglycerate kinase [Ichthyobacterium seriolicida]|uniref:Phosphoglycerate kinase n=1 Tax=Ichthyobacterium seriolicida TaxID=242600 RepID=A0A1J1EAN0_9FLAO|nr:phosphoglycerate kinase [Ichthyobacterium seriolicida]BAV94995.1 phosphoglycerate kinase [Ichthyobacterium seriolicida]